MHKPFNLEAARRGDPIEVFTKRAQWERREFIGTFCGPLGLMIVYVEGNEPDFTVLAGVRMAAKKRTVYLNIYKHGQAAWYLSDADAQRAATVDVIRAGMPIEIEE